jgi:hypothetical protein
MTGLVDVLFGCWHKNYSFPITTKHGERRCEAAQLTGTYVVCLDCGKEFAYDWQEMHVISRSEVKKRLGKLNLQTPAVLPPVESFASTNSRAA